MRFHGSGWVWVFIMSATVFGGQVVFNNGDRLTGTVTRMTDGVVTVETELAGTVTIPVENIRSMTTDEPVELVYADGATAMQAVSDSTALEEITAINPPKPEPPRWKGDVAGGLVYTRGNTWNESYNVSANAQKRTEITRTTLKGDTAKKKEKSSGSDDEATTEDWLKTLAKYDYYLSKKMYVFGEGRYETDELADLDSRIIYGGGTGYQWIESETLNVATEAGLSCIYENYGNNGTDKKLSARAGYHFDAAINQTFSFIHDLAYFPSTEDLGDYYLTSSTELRAKLNAHWFLNAKVLFDYDAIPATGEGSTDIKYLFGAGFSF